MEKYSLDLDSLNKGSVITESELEKILKISAQDSDFWKRKLKFKWHIMKHFEDKDYPIRVIERQGNLVILTDEQSSAYSFWQWNCSLRRATSNETFLHNVDTRNLSSTERLTHLRRVEVVTKVMQATNQAIRVIPAEVKVFQTKLPTLSSQIRCISA